MVAGMLMPLRDLRAIYEVLFRDGVMVAKKDKRPQTKHPEVHGVCNLQVIRAMGSLKSRGFVKETFAWRHFYWYLTNEGIVYLRDYLHLPLEIVPASLQRFKKSASTLAMAQRAARVQYVEGPTSYVPKPGHRGDTESQEALAERQSYRHRMMGPREKESYSDRTPRFRGRPLSAEHVRPKEMDDQSHLVFTKRNKFQGESMPMDRSHQQPDVSNEKTTSQGREISEVQMEKQLSLSSASKATWKNEVAKPSLNAGSSKTTPLLTVAPVAEAPDATDGIKCAPSSLKGNTDKMKIADANACKIITSNSTSSAAPETKIKKVLSKEAVASYTTATTPPTL
ncbi:uncharacterized protein LOC144022317 [Festucalex cinctus]